MPDEFDRAQELEQLQRDQALHNQLNQPTHKPLIIDGVRCCLGCEEDISERLKVLPNAVRCVICQEQFEKQHQMEL